MLRLRSAIVVLGLALVVWLASTFLVAGRDVPATERLLAGQFDQLGLPALSAVLLSRAAEGYRGRVAALTQRHASPEAVARARTRLGECELAAAAVFRDGGNRQRARDHLIRARDLAPEVATEASSWLAYLETMGGGAGPGKAKRDLLKLFLDHPDDPMPSYLVGLAFLEEGRPPEAIHYLSRSLAAPHGDRPETRVALARAYDRKKNRTTAVAQAQKALALASTPLGKREAARLLQQLGAAHPNPALIAAQTFAHQHRIGLWCALLVVLVLFYPALLHVLGRCAPGAAAQLYLLGRSTEPLAVSAYEAALRRQPDNARLLEAVARAYRRVGVGTQRAAELYERLWAARPDDSQALNEAVRLALQSGRDTEPAVRACQTWFDTHRDDPQAVAVASYLGRAYRSREARAPQSALTALELALTAAPADRELRRSLGILYSHFGQWDAAVRTLQPLVISDPEDLASRQEYAHALIGQGAAYTAYRHLRVLPPSAETTADLYLAGVAADQAGRHREALRILEEVLRRDPGLFDVEERVATAAARTRQDRLGRITIRGTVAACEAYLVCRAEHPQHGPVLLLVFRREFSDELAFPERFAAELARPRQPSPGVAEIVDFGADQEEYYVAYRTPPGTPLSGLTETEGALAPARAAEVMSAALVALGASHAAGRVHGDLRPPLIWVAGDRAMLVGGGMSLTAAGDQSLGPPGPRSPFYVAPEVVRNEESAPAADIYSAGCVLYELMVGAPPVEGPTHLATMMAHVAVEPMPPSMRAPAVPDTMDQVVMTALAKDPHERFASAEEFASALQPFVGTRATTAAPEPAPVVEVAAIPPPDLAHPPDPGRWWTFYESTALVATARFAKVYRGTHRLTGERHAIKQLQAPQVAGADEQAVRATDAVRRLFLNEMHLLQSLSEEPEPIAGIVRMVQAYRGDERSPAYAMPLMTEPLSEHLTRTGALPESEALTIAREIGSALAALHDRGIIHRGVSPRSVLFSDQGRTQLGGFDRACRVEERAPLLAAERDLHVGSASPLDAMGEIGFASPEQCRSEDFDHRTDVYSFGCLLWCLLTGWAPFERPDPLQVMLDHLSTPPPRLQDWGVNASAGVQQVLDRALAKSPTDRFASIEEMLAGLPQ